MKTTLGALGRKFDGDAYDDAVMYAGIITTTPQWSA